MNSAFSRLARNKDETKREVKHWKCRQVSAGDFWKFSIKYELRDCN